MNKQPLLGGAVQDIDEEFDTPISEQGSIIKLLEVLQEIDSSTPMAKINEVSIDDNNGGRIAL